MSIAATHSFFGVSPFDVVVHGFSDKADPGAYTAAGATWWLEDLHDMRAPFPDLLSLVANGPPQ